MICLHESCSSEKKVWLPVENNQGADIALHPWCIHCGIVKNISEDKPKKLGYWINILSKMSYQFSFTQCQKRLIVKELQSNEEFEDIYGINASSQKELFIKIIQKHCNLSGNNIDSFVC